MNLYDLQHILYIVITAILTVVGLILIKKFCKSQKLAILIAAAALLVVFIWNRLSLAIVEKDALKLLPYSFCSLTSLLLSVLTLSMKNRNHPVFHCVLYLAILGPILTFIYPAFVIGIDASIFGMRTISGMLHHSLALFLAILLLMFGEFKPDWRKWWCLTLGLCVYATFGFFEIRALGFSNAMDLNAPFIPGTFFWWYVVGPMVAIGIPLIVFCYEQIHKKLKKTVDIEKSKL